MNTKPLILTSLLIGLLSLPFASRADDIDIYAGLGGSANAPNMMFVIDSTANADASFGTCHYDLNTLGDGLGGTPSNGSNTLGNEQCALVNIVKFMPTRSITDPSTGVVSQVAMLNLGITSSDGVYLMLTPIDDKPYAGTFPGTTGMTDRQAFIYAAKALAKSPHLVDMGDQMQETWAYYTGGDGTLSTGSGGTGIPTAQGLISGTVYPASSATSGCQKNYALFLGATANSSHPNDLTTTGTINMLKDSVTLYENSLVASNTITQAVATANIAKLTAIILNGYLPDKYAALPASWAREWARFMFTQDVNTSTAASGTQSIVTYSISVGGGNVDMTNFIGDMANVGGGKTYTAATYADIYNYILKILNEVQAVNSVFSSSSLPVSVNAQGTFLNQIYMGMFRPDAGANPRWVGNLKQYQFIYNTTTNSLSLGDSLGLTALSSAGTGFISPNAISFWTCTDLTTSPYLNTWLTGSTTPLTSAQINILKLNLQNCGEPSTLGFWASDSGSAIVLAQSFDLPDGERVERGAIGQRLRINNLIASYTGTALATGGTELSPRKLYTWCPSGSGCVANLTDTSNAFSVNNTGITANSSLFGTSSSQPISSMSRNPAIAADNLVTVTTNGAHGFSTGDAIQISNAIPSDYNGTYTITKVDATHFTYYLAAVYQPSSVTPTANTNYVASSTSGLVTQTITAMSYASNTVTVTVPSHGFATGSSVTIASVAPTAYNGTFTITVINANTFSYSMPEQPPTIAGSPAGTTSATVSIVTKANGSGCPCSTTFYLKDNATPGVSRTLGSTTVTYTTTTPTTGTTSFASNFLTAYPNATIAGVVGSNGASVTAYNGTLKITSVSGNTFTITTTIAPSAPAITASSTAAGVAPLTISSLTRVGNTATATVRAHPFTSGSVVSIGSAAGTTPVINESAYLGSYTVSNVTANTFDYAITTTPAASASAITGSTMTATPTSSFSATNMNALINWVRGQDNKADEESLCPGAVSGGIAGKNYANCPATVVTVRPSVHGDVLHSRPTVLNYGSYAIAITGTSDSSTTRTATVSAADGAQIVSSGGVTPVVTFANGQACPVTVATSLTSFTYLNTGCGDAGAQAAFTGSKVVVFYGDNGGVFHAVNGNQTSTYKGAGPGGELWGFVPKELFIKLNRQRDNSPQLVLPSTPPGISPTPRSKDYFIDGSAGVYQVIDGNGTTTRAVLFLAMRRGGNFIYALDVTDPANPTVLWKVDNTGLTTPSGFTASTDYQELGQTWSQPKVAMVNGHSTPVLIFGAGYDTNQDSEPIANVDVSGRGIYILDALTGAKLWSATAGAANSCTGNATKASCTVIGMNYSIPSDITLMDSGSSSGTRDGITDRLYAADTGGNIWRVDLEPAGGNTPNFWQINKLAALGCGTGPCANPSNPTQRKFFYPPEVIPHTTTSPYDSVIAGSGDREHPLYVSTTTQRANRLYLLKDTYTGLDASGMAALGSGFPITMTANNGNSQQGLFDATTTPWNGTLAGYYITLGAGEKVVNAPLAVAGYVYLGTNTPPAPNTNSCVNSLGVAQGYQLSTYAGTYTKIQFDGGGLPPSPVAGVVNIVVGGVVKEVPFIIGGGNPNCTGGADCKSAEGGQKPPIKVPTTRKRNYWYIEGK